MIKATDNNSNAILVAIKPNGTAKVNNVIIDSNFLLSAYGKEEIIKYYDKVISHSKILYPANANKKQIVKELARLQLPRKLQQSVNSSIPNSAKNASKNSKNLFFTILDLHSLFYLL